MGRLSDTIGRRPLYLGGLALISATTAWCAFAQSIGSFIAARAFCGVGAAGVLAMGKFRGTHSVTEAKIVKAMS
jgi:MFS family permease